MIQERAISRAVARAESAKSLDRDEIAALFAARGEQLERLLAVARRIRDLGMEEAGRPGSITYSRNVFIPLTRLCRDRCHYCTFVASPAVLAARGESMYMTPDEVVEVARRGAELGCKEALFTLGDRPEDRYPEAQQWLEEAGYSSTVDYVRAMAIRVLEETGLLPHLNLGVLSWEEISRLRPVAASMGMMLETTSRNLLEPGQPHHRSPDKDPEVRIRVLEDAGRLSVPFTSGLLVGIGETVFDRADSVLELRRVNREYGSLQEVIIQNFRSKPDTPMRHQGDLPVEEYLAAIATSRVVLGQSVRVQAPPNLVDLAECRRLLDAGVDDLGGVSPVTADHVNPERPWPDLEALDELCAGAGVDLVERLALHPEHVGPQWIDPRLRPHVEALSTAEGLADPDAVVEGRPWQEPDGAWGDSGRTDLHSAIDRSGRNTDTRSDFDEVFGDWAALREQVRTAPALAGEHLGSVDVAAALRAAEANPSGLSAEQALTLMSVPEGPGLEALCSLANDLRKDAVGDAISYVVNRNINFTNVCYTGCRFCAFAQRASDADAYTLSLETIAERAQEAVALGATEVCVQGGIDPSMPANSYEQIARTITTAAPSLHLHAYSPMEVMNGVSRTGLSIREFLQSVQEAGVGSLPGTAAEILDDDIRWVLTKGKLPAAQWVEVVTTAHSIGLPTTSTMMYGHVDHPRHWVGHLSRLAEIQRETGGFTEFVPLPFVHKSSPIYLAGVARPGPSLRDNRVVHAMARIMLHGLIDNIQCSWVKLGDEDCATVLRGGVNDVGGTLMEETISRMAGSDNGSARTEEELRQMAQLAGPERFAVQRTTLYQDVVAAH